MITTPTVLVLGAGASYPYGFPTAKELKHLICQAFSNPDATASRLLGDNSDYSRDEFFAFREAFLKSGQPSVDAFLERRQNYLGVGKLAIAYCLVPFENETKLFSPDESRGGNWYEYLSVKLNASFEEFGENALSIITFNYDRSLEHYLLTSLHNLYGKRLDECAATLSKIPIIHVYGQLGKIPYPCRDCLPYQADNTRFINVGRAAAGITLLHEESADLRQAHELLKNARRICFLGFSYHPMNLQRLALKDSSSQRRVFGSARGLVGGEIGEVIQRLSSTLYSGGATVTDADNLHLLRQHLILG